MVPEYERAPWRRERPINIGQSRHKDSPQFCRYAGRFCALHS